MYRVLDESNPAIKTGRAPRRSNRGKQSEWRIAALLLFFLPVLLFAQSPHTVSLPNADSLAAYLRWTPDRTPLLSAHRGGPEPGYPENALETFEHSLAYAPCLIECDVRKTADSVLVMMHDETVDRTTTGTGRVEDLTFNEIRSLHLVDNEGVETPYRVPTFAEVLHWAKGRAVLTVDVKWPVAPEEIIRAVRGWEAEGHAVVITYNAESAATYHRLAPELVLSVSVRQLDDITRLREAGVNLGRVIAFVGVGEPEPALYEVLHHLGIRAILGTMGNLDRKAAARGVQVYEGLLERGADILATDTVPLAVQALKQPRRSIRIQVGM